MTVRASLAALALLLMPLAALPSFAQRGGAHAGPRPATAPRAGDFALPRHDLFKPVLPDTVLALVKFPDGESRVTVSALAEAAHRFETDPAVMTPETRRELLRMLVDQAALDHRVARTPPTWLHRDSTAYASYVEGVLIRAALDSALADMRARFLARRDSVPAEKVLDVMVRDSAMASLGRTFGMPAVDTLTAAFLALPQDDMRLPVERRRELRAMAPKIAPADSDAVLGRVAGESCTIGDLLRDFTASGLFHRPSVHTARDVLELVDNRLYSHLLRSEAQRQGMESRPDVAALLATRKRFITVQRFVQNETYDKVATDSATVRRWFTRQAKQYELGATARIVRAVYPRREQADSAARSLASPGVAESLATRTMDNGMPYLTMLGEAADTALFARVRRGGVGAVVGPDATPDGWRAFKVMSLSPRKPQTFAEAFVRARGDWVESDGDRRMKALLATLRTQCRVTIHETSPYLTAPPARAH